MSRLKTAYFWRRAGLLLIVAGCAVLIVSAANPNTPEGFLVIAHRGASGNEPENTMAAFEEAERLGSDYIEFDVQLSKDGELVVIHDDTVDRTTEHTGPVDEYTLGELEEMDAPAGKTTDTDDEATNLVSFEAVMERFAGKMGMLIEVKESPNEPGVEEKVANVVRQYEFRLNYTAFGQTGSIHGMKKLKNTAAIMIQSYDFESTRLIHSLLPDVPVAALIHEDKHPLSDEVLDELTSYAAYINYTQDLLDEEIVKKIHDRNRKVIAWTIQSDEQLVRMKQLGVDGVITDYPG
ncbi:glycerophosphodiester phosphodiesterase [Paenibacillus paridis]|uniref:glycerophosphodiester phosphodiesterase n=1 Tax=Paenibacillus paridis TaxID=2583376 RepID=UPI001122A82F|nr:glycerophosphodiester phosphodiesterase family protein [Paenibacillus paridis]